MKFCQPLQRGDAGGHRTAECIICHHDVKKTPLLRRHQSRSARAVQVVTIKRTDLLFPTRGLIQSGLGDEPDRYRHVSFVSEVTQSSDPLMALALGSKYSSSVKFFIHVDHVPFNEFPEMSRCLTQPTYYQTVEKQPTQRHHDHCELASECMVHEQREVDAPVCAHRVVIRERSGEAKAGRQSANKTVRREYNG